VFSIRYNRTTNHIDGIEVRTPDGGEERGGVIPYYAQNACGVITKGSLAQGKSFDSLADALEDARKGGRKLCKKCEAAALATLEAAEKAQEEPQAPKVEKAPKKAAKPFSKRDGAYRIAEWDQAPGNFSIYFKGRQIALTHSQADALVHVEEHKASRTNRKPGKAPENFVYMAKNANTEAARRYWAKLVATYGG
jgi:hypothetical protein